MKPVVAIVGRPNVGKSTLFNRITRSRKAIVVSIAGATRDRNYFETEWEDVPLILIDTGGFDTDSSDDLKKQIKSQAMLAVYEADVIVFLGDGSDGLMPDDREMIKLLLKSGKPLIGCMNKSDLKESKNNIYDFYKLGFDEVYPVSAAHGHGLGDMMDAVIEKLPKTEPVENKIDDYHCKVAFIGKPNVGKSSLANNLLGEKRLLADATPGTTRDSIDSVINYDNKKYLVVDTAGIRRKRSVKEVLEKFSIIMALKSIDRCDIAVLLLDCTEKPSTQDAKIANLALESGKALLVVANKWDLPENKHQAVQKEFKSQVYDILPRYEHVPVIFTSAKTGKGVNRIFKMVDQIIKEYSKRIKTPELNNFLQEIVTHHSPPLRNGKAVRMYYIAQIKDRPPTFAISTNVFNYNNESYKRFIENQLRERFGFSACPISIIFRKKKTMIR